MMARRGGGLGAHSTAIEVSGRIEADQDTVELARAARSLSTRSSSGLFDGAHGRMSSRWCCPVVMGKEARSVCGTCMGPSRSQNLDRDVLLMRNLEQNMGIRWAGNRQNLSRLNTPRPTALFNAYLVPPRPHTWSHEHEQRIDEGEIDGHVAGYSSGPISGRD